jgi:hypothetical protein
LGGHWDTDLSLGCGVVGGCVGIGLGVGNGGDRGRWGR